MSFTAEIQGEAEPEDASEQFEGYFRETARRDTPISSRRGENTAVDLEIGDKKFSDRFNKDDILGGEHENDTGKGILDAFAKDTMNAMVDASNDQMQEKSGLRTPNRTEGAENPGRSSKIPIDPGHLHLDDDEDLTYEMNFSHGNTEGGAPASYSLSAMADGTLDRGYDTGRLEVSDRDAIMKISDSVARNPDMDSTAGMIARDKEMLPDAETVEEVSAQTEVTTTTKKAYELVQEIAGHTTYDCGVEAFTDGEDGKTGRMKTVDMGDRSIEELGQNLAEMKSDYGMEEVQVEIGYEATSNQGALEPQARIEVTGEFDLEEGPAQYTATASVDNLTAFRKPDAVETAFLLGQRAHEYAV
jgi:hypothetical protein